MEGTAAKVVVVVPPRATRGGVGGRGGQNMVAGPTPCLSCLKVNKLDP